MKQTDRTRQSGTRASRKRWLIALAVALVIVELIWVIGANWALSSGFVSEKINRRPEKLLVEWKSARTWVPVWINLEGVTVRVRSKQQQIFAALDELRVHCGLLPLISGTIKVYDLRSTGLDFRMRMSRPSSPKENSDEPLISNGALPVPDEPTVSSEAQPISAEEPPVSSEAPPISAGDVPPDLQPEIPGLAPDAPIESAAPAGKKKGKQRPWTLQVDDAHFADIRQIWIGTNRLSGEGSIEARVEVRTKGGPIAVDRVRIDLENARLRIRGFDVAEALRLEIDGSMDSFVAREYEGFEVLKMLTAVMSVSGTTTSVGLVNALLSRVETVSVESQGGQIDGKLRIDRGVLREGTDFAIVAPTGWVHIADWQARGGLGIQTRVERTDGGEASTHVDVTLDELEMISEGETEPFLERASLELAASADEVDLSGGGKAIADALRVASVDLRDAHVADLSRFPVPALGDFTLKSGDIRVDTSATIGREGGRARVVVGGSGIGATYQDVTMQGDLAIELDVEATDGRLREFALKESFVHIDDVVVSNQKAEQANWFLHLDIEEGQAAMTDPGSLASKVDIVMQDTRPLVALLTRDKKTLSALSGLLEFDHLQGTATVQVGDEIVQFEDIVLSSKGLELEADLRLAGEETTGLLWTRFRGIPLSLDLRGGKSKLHLIQPRQWYDAQTDPFDAPAEPGGN